MSTQNRISKALAALLPGGALGASILLALSNHRSPARRQCLRAPPGDTLGGIQHGGFLAIFRLR
jgi:hypothetical protein